ncbi:MAG TPA: alpha/beta fold hydrolase [Thermoanaerobaculia bacterium]|nr:alpha/beta fold hydrolase [Thermoanaerobaculia bacterium]
MTGRTLLFLPGLLGDASSLWQQEAELSPDHTVIAADYPDTPSIRHQLDALLQALDARGAERAVVIGQTLGGYLAQAFARAHPERVEALVLVHAGLPDPRVAKRIRRDLAFARLLPWPVLRGWLHRHLRKMLAGLEAAGDVSPEQGRVVAGHFRHRFAELLDKPRVLARYRLLANLHEAPPMSPGGFPGPALILYSEGNVFARQLERLKAVFPGAAAHAMGRRHNLSLLVRPEESHRLIRGLLDSLPPV